MNIDRFQKIISAIKPDRHIISGQRGSEENVKIKFVVPLLQFLGYDPVSDMNFEVNGADIVLVDGDSRPQIVVETKSWDQEITDHLDQCLEYTFKHRVPFILITLVSEAVLLFVAAQTGFIDGPRVLSYMALDKWVPTRFATLSDRFVTLNGVLIMGAAALILMVSTRGSVALLVVLYSINVFITFTLSQAGMVRHWWIERKGLSSWRRKFVINGVGLVLTVFILVSIVVVKFTEGGWITLVVTGTFILIVAGIRRHYENTAKLLKRLDALVMAAGYSSSEEIPGITKKEKGEFDPEAKTAVLLVNGFNGTGLHTLFNIFRLFGDSFKNFVFVQVGVIDAGNFKGAEELDKLQTQVKSELDRYVSFVTHHGYHAESIYSIGTDVVEEVAQIAPNIVERYPQAVFFGGQIVFPKETFLTRLLHNYTVFSMQRKFYHEGIPVVILPIRV